MAENQLLVITGPTASGKTTIAANIAVKLNGEVISADSRQVFRGMDLGTGKDLADYVVNGKEVACHLVDIVEPGHEYSVYEFSTDFRKACDDICGRNKLPILCGGTGMYIDAVLRGYRLDHVPENKELRSSLEDKSLDELTRILTQYKDKLHNISDISDRERAVRAIEIQNYYLDHPGTLNKLTFGKSRVFGIRYDRAILRQRISDRLELRLQQGMVEEVRDLLSSGISPERLHFYGLEYRFLTDFILDRLTYEEMVGKLRTAIHQFSKRQMTWFRRMERMGVPIDWIGGEMALDKKVEHIISKWGDK